MSSDNKKIFIDMSASFGASSVKTQIFDLSFLVPGSAPTPTGWTGKFIGISSPAKVNGLTLTSDSLVNGV